MAVLRQTTGPLPNPTVPLNRDSMRIGRQSDCELLLDCRDVSRHHARIFRSRGRHVIEDLDSRNGTQVNGLTIQEAVPLHDGDRITISSLEFLYLANAPSDTAPPPPVTPAAMTDTVSVSAQSSLQTKFDVPITVRRGDRVPVRSVGESVPDAAVIARFPVVGPDGQPRPLQHAEAALASVLSLQKRLKTTLSRSGILKRTINSLLKMFPAADTVAVVIQDPQEPELLVEATGRRHPELPVRLSVPVVTKVLRSGTALACHEHGIHGPRELPLRTVLCVPLSVGGSPAEGVIQMDSRDVSSFDQQSVERLACLARTIACQLETVKAIEREARPQLPVSAADTVVNLRQNIAPVRAPQVEGFRLRHQLLTVPAMAADLIDYVRLNDGRQACFILDVPGRGPEAAGLMAAMASVMTRALLASASPGETIRRAEEDLRTRMSEVPVLTSVCVAVVDPQRGTVTISVAGHCLVFHVTGDRVRSITEDGLSGPPIGAPRDAYQEFEMRLAPDEQLLLCSDGISRITRRDGCLVSRSDIHEMIRAACRRSATDFCRQLASDLLEQHAGDSLPDDIALLTIHRSESPTPQEARA